MSRIRILPDDLINQIAAGEVIERPSSVVKELVENALDAGSRSLAVDIEAGGRRRVRVADDGEGLDRDDALLAFERHATSKLQAAPDLGRIATLGFRGEALPAIASVARVTLLTSRDGRSGTRVEVEAGRILRVSEAGHPRGTTVDVRDLFFNTPARGKFLRSFQTELGHVSDLVSACAVSAPSVRVTLTHEGRRLIDVPPATDHRERIAQLFGRRWREAIAFEGSRGRMTAQGLIAPPETSASTRRMQHLYVNGRPVKDRVLGHAILSACEAFFPRERHAEVFVFISCPPGTVDVNVHPAKAEVRFTDARAIHDALQAAIAGALRGILPVTALGVAGAAVTGSTPPAEPVAAAGAAEGPRAVHEATQRYLAAAARDTGISREAGGAVLPSIDAGAEALAHYRECYIVAADRDGLLLIDQHAAHERILFERLARGEAGARGEDERQKLLFPLTAQAPRRLAARLGEVAGELDRLGIGAEPFGDGMLVVREAPAILGASDLPRAVADLLDQMAAEEAPDGDPALRREKLLATIACHAAVKARMPLTMEKMNYLIKELFRTSRPLKCPHGRPSVLRIAHNDLEKGFMRS